VTFFTGTQTEVLYCMPAAGATFATAATVALSGNSTSNPPYQLPALNALWGAPSYAVGRAIKVIARGVFDSSAASNMTIGCYLDPTQGSTSAQITLAATGALSWPSTTTGNFELEFDIVVQSIGVGATACNLVTGGLLTVGVGANATATAASTYMVGNTNSGGTATAIGVNPATSYFLEIWGTQTVTTRTTQLTQLLVYGQN
jgi:hypothetical protein